MAFGRFGHAATLLPNGKILAASGLSWSLDGRAELYDPMTNRWTAAGSLTIQCFQPTATFLLEGRVSVARGYDVLNSCFPPLASNELFDPTGWSYTAAST